MRFPGLVLIVALACSLGCGGKTAVQQAAQPVELAFGELGGEYVNYRADFGINSNIEGSVRSWLSTIDFKVKATDMGAEGMERRFEFDDFTVTYVAGGTPEPDPKAPEYGGTTLWLKTDPEGNIVDWKGLDGVGGRTSDGRRFKEYIVYQLMAMFQPPPGQPVNAGSTWRNEYEIRIPTGAVMATYKTVLDYTVDGFGVRNGRECAKIDLALTIEASGTGTMGGKETWFESQESGTGEIWFDYVNGLIVEYARDTTASQETRAERAGKEDITSMATTVDSEVKIRLVE